MSECQPCENFKSPKVYAGIGSRLTPVSILEIMYEIAVKKAVAGWTLRSGGASGADHSFEDGCDFAKGSKEIFLPWRGFNGSTSKFYDPPYSAFLMAKDLHPAWNKLTDGAKRLHARNCQQILGLNLDDSVDEIICWTPGGELVGGTATAIKLANKHNIPVINLGLPEFMEK